MRRLDWRLVLGYARATPVPQCAQQRVAHLAARPVKRGSCPHARDRPHLWPRFEVEAAGWVEAKQHFLNALNASAALPNESGDDENTGVGLVVPDLQVSGLPRRSAQYIVGTRCR